MRGVARLAIAASFVIQFATMLVAQGAQVPALQGPPAAPPQLQLATKLTSIQTEVTALTNEDVIRLVSVKVSDETVIAVINEAQVKQFDLSASAVGDMVLRGVSTAVITAMRQPSRATQPSATDIDRRKFDKVYEAGKAVNAAKYIGIDGVTPRQFQDLLRAFRTEIDIAEDKATTPAERSLTFEYSMVYIVFDTARMERILGTDSGAMEKASAQLEAANKIYLGK